MKTYTIEEAEKKGLVQLFVWVDQDEMSWLESEYKRLIANNKDRKVMMVEYRNRFTLYVNDLTDGR